MGTYFKLFLFIFLILMGDLLAFQLNSTVQLQVVSHSNRLPIEKAFVYFAEMDVFFQSDSFGYVTCILPEMLHTRTLNLLIKKNGFTSYILTLFPDSTYNQPILVEIQRHYPQPSGIGFNIIGKVVDQRNKPIEGVKIFIANLERTYLSNKEGQFALCPYELFQYDQIHLFFIKKNHLTTHRTFELPPSRLESLKLDPIKMISSGIKKTLDEQADERELRFHFHLDESSHKYLKILYHSPLSITREGKRVGELKSDTSTIVQMKIPKNEKEVVFWSTSDKFEAQKHEIAIGKADNYFIRLHLREPFIDISIHLKKPNNTPLPNAKIFQGSQLIDSTDINGEAKLSLKSSLNKRIRIEVPAPYAPTDTFFVPINEKHHYVIKVRYPQYFILKGYDRGDGHKVEIWEKVSKKGVQQKIEIDEFEETVSSLVDELFFESDILSLTPTIDLNKGLLILNPQPDSMNCLIQSLQNNEIDTVVTTPCEPLSLPPGKYFLELSKEYYQTWCGIEQIVQNKPTIIKEVLNRRTDTLKINLKIDGVKLNTPIKLKLEHKDTVAHRIQMISEDSSEYHIQFDKLPCGVYSIDLDHHFYELDKKEINHNSSSTEHIVSLSPKNKTIQLFIAPIAPYAFRLDYVKVYPKIIWNVSYKLKGAYQLEDVPFGKHKLGVTRRIGDSILKDEWEIEVKDSISTNYYFHFQPKFHYNFFSTGQTWMAYPPVKDSSQTHILFEAATNFPVATSNPKYAFGAYIQLKNAIDFYIRSPLELVDSNKAVMMNGNSIGVKYDLRSSEASALAGLFEYCNNLMFRNSKHSQKLSRIDLKILYTREIKKNDFIDLNFGVSTYFGQDELSRSVVRGDLMTLNVARRVRLIQSFTLSYEISWAFRLDSEEKQWDGILGASIDYRLNPSLLISLNCSGNFGTSHLLKIYHPHQFSRTVIGLCLLTLLE